MIESTASWLENREELYNIIGRMDSPYPVSTELLSTAIQYQQDFWSFRRKLENCGQAKEETPP